jgi:hypothetical protein
LVDRKDSRPTRPTGSGTGAPGSRGRHGERGSDRDHPNRPAELPEARPAPGYPDAQSFFIFSPEEMRDLLLALTTQGPRQLPLPTALARFAEHDVVMFSVGDPAGEPHAFEWGYLSAVAVEEAPAAQPTLGAYAEFYFERSDGQESMIGLQGLASTALVTEDAVTFEDEGGAVVIAVAEPAPETLNVPGMVVAWEWDRGQIIELAQSTPPAFDDDDDAGAEGARDEDAADDGSPGGAQA